MYSLILCWFLNCVVALVAAEEEPESSISINKPIMKSHEPWVHFSTDYVRCFCNLPACISTGYMCKSSGGGCFSDLLSQSAPSSAAYRGRHGCLELLTDKEQRKWCAPIAENESQQNKKHPKSLFLCCHHDMCNHVDSPQTKNLINNTLLLGDILDDSENTHKISNNAPEQFLYSNSEVWFRAATIAVPICGAVILFVLIALAVKILRNENESSTDDKLRPSMYVHHMGAHNQRKTSCEKYSNDYCDRNYDNLVIHSLKNSFYSNPVEDGEVGPKQQVPLLMNDATASGASKNETNAKLNLMQGEKVDDCLIGDNYILQLKKETADCPDVNMVHYHNSDKKYDLDRKS